MASRRRADGFLTKLINAARVGRVLPTLVLAVALSVAGCGGDDSADTATTDTTAAVAKAAGGPGAEKDGNGQGAKSGIQTGDGSKAKQANAGGEGASPGGSPSAEGRHGPRVPQPTGNPEPGITPEQRRKATTASVALASSAFAPGSSLPIKYTCDGKDESPPLRWAGVPSEAAELVLLVLNTRPVDESLFFDWAVAGLDPSLSSLDAGSLPSGAVVGRNSFGKRRYSICPAEGGTEDYIFMLYAIPKALSPKPGFNPLAVREAVLAQAGNVGLLGVSYARS